MSISDPEVLYRSMRGLSREKAKLYAPYINDAMLKGEITTLRRAQYWIAQLAHESVDLRYFEEIASGAAYEGRRDLGNTQPGDGRRFKGRGPIQLTGRSNYASFGRWLGDGDKFTDDPKLVATPKYGFLAALYYWSTRDLNSYCDRSDFRGLTRRINGGYNGLADRYVKLAYVKRLGKKILPTGAGGGKPVKVNVRIKRVQDRLRKIGFPIKADGVKGPATRQAIREFQRGYARAKLPVNGEVRRISRTYRAIRWSVNHGGRASENFTFREFASNGNGWIKLDRDLVRALEVYRKRVGHGVEIVSGYRDCEHNNNTPGAADCSRHSDCCGNPGGDAADFAPELSFEQVKELGVFTGIGISANGLVRHGDVRPGSVKSPTTWTYP